MSTTITRPQARVVYTTRTGSPNHADVVARIHRASVRPVDTGLTCRTRTPEPHGWGEFPMTCYDCHLAADD